jgi:hypothetical protein
MVELTEDLMEALMAGLKEVVTVGSLVELKVRLRDI